ncbi:prenylcysteine oxidase-like [Nilaparvata lugens]|uniref:prenylcysteine oxidase n=1 Tax=Nilaparvata lugens TaxID=108931 RepID=UPI000B997047|nr:prenylcysteine oxidase [Nilaparvata lugens]XP_039297337.1 prenylcysteine oxidase-like [Nilaparvata lugens]
MGFTLLKYSLSSIVILYFFGFNAGAVDVFSLFKRECGKKPSIAIIGAGIGGTSCAYFLSELFEKDVYIDIFEADEVGGRLKSQLIGGIEVELGGAVLHPRNKYMRSFVKKFGLEYEVIAPGRAGIYNGKEFIFLESGWNIIDWIRMVYRYGLSNSYHFFRNIEFMLDRFERAYSTLEKGYAFRSAEHMLEYMHPSFPAMRNVTIEDAFRLEFGDLMYEEIILPIMRVNYGQGGNLHQFVGSVSLAGAMPELWSVKGGNRRVAEELLKASSALILRSPVYQILYNEFDRNYHLSFPQTSEGDLRHTEAYDIVVVAAPITENSEFPIDFGHNILTELYKPRPYHTTHVTIVEGSLNYSVFNCSVDPLPTEIYTPNSNLMFNSLSRLSKDDSKIELWKIFSDEPLNDFELEMLFEEDFIVRLEKVWEAYPQYEVPAPIEDSFFIQQNMYYLNAVEWAASAIEMSVLSAKNIAVIIHRVWQRSNDYRSCFFCKGPDNFWHK